MKWFKHYCNAKKSDLLVIVMDKFGKHRGYACYWLLVAYFVDKLDDRCDTSFTVSLQDLATSLALKPYKCLEFLAVVAEQRGIQMEQNGNILKIEFPKLLEIQDRDSKYTRTKRGDDAIEKNKIKIKKKIKNKIYDYEFLYSLFPRKEGKKIGVARCKTIITSDEKYKQVETSIKNYTKYCIDEKTEKQFIKIFSSFMSSWEDWLDSETGTCINPEYSNLLDESLDEHDEELINAKQG